MDSPPGQQTGSEPPRPSAAPTRARKNAQQRANHAARTAALPQIADPRTLLVDIAPELATPDPGLVAMVAKHGLQAPITVAATTRGLQVLEGRRRVLAAVAAGLTAIPIRVVIAGTDSTN